MNNEQGFENVSSNEERVYFKALESGHIGNYSIGFDILISGIIDPILIKRAFVNTIQKHPNLNYYFFITKDGIFKRKIDNNSYSFSLIANANKDLNELKKEIVNDACINIDPEKGQNIATSLFKLSDSEYILSVTVSHLVADAQSMEILLKDFLAELKAQRLNSNQSKKSLTFLPPMSINRQPSYEITKTLKLPQIQKLKILYCQEDVSLFSLLMAGLATVFEIKTDSIGVLFSNRTKKNKNEIGCFVQAIPVYLYEKQAVLQMAKGVRDQVSKIHTLLKNGSTLPSPPSFNVMFSMVKNPDTFLHGPDGVSIEYLRRLHTKPECSLHIYAYQYQDKIEIVFNYDPDKWKLNDLEKMLDHYVESLNMLSDQKNCQPGYFHNVESQKPYVLFDHVGIAAWEMDIGLLRLKTGCNIDTAMKRVKDNEMSVELASFDIGIASRIELVAPLNETSPCVGYLERLGEGPYHSCWKTTSIENILKFLNQRAVDYMVIDRYGQSALFPNTPILFLMVQGVGLVELIETEQVSNPPSEPLFIEIVSNDLENAAKFLHIFGCKPDNPTRATWQDPFGIKIKINAKEEGKESFIFRISSISSEKNEDICSPNQSLSAKWKQRVCI